MNDRSADIPKLMTHFLIVHHKRNNRNITLRLILKAKHRGFLGEATRGNQLDLSCHKHRMSVEKYFIRFGFIHRQTWFEVPWKNLHGKNILLFNVTGNLTQGTIWRHIKEHTQARGHLYGQNVTRFSQTDRVWGTMKGSTQKRSHLLTPKVTELSQTYLVWGSMKISTREKSHLPVDNVIRLLTIGTIWRHIKGHT